MKSSRKTFAIINILITLLFVIIPIIIFASFECFPGFKKNTQILFWIMFILCPLINIIWTILFVIKPTKEVSVPIMQVGGNLILCVLPLINLCFTFFDEEAKWVIAFPLIIDLLAFVAYIIFMLYLANFSKKVNNSVAQTTATSYKIVNQDETFNNKDGSFKGSRLKK